MRVLDVAILRAAIVAGVAALLSFAQAGAQVSTPPAPTHVPSVRIMTGALVAPNPSYGTSTSSSNGLCASLTSLPQASFSQLCSGFRPPEVRELARALKNDPNLIYEYVRNSVDTEFQFGLQKGALGVIIDGTGTPFDQAELMVELLREASASYNPVYQYGTITLSGSGFFNWTGITDAGAACNFLATGGIPATVNSTTPASCATLAGTTVTGVTMQHIWVQATVNGGTYLFDPSYKPFTHKFGMTPTKASGAIQPGVSVQTAMSYSAGSALTAATTGMASGTSSVTGTATTAPYVSSLNATGASGLNSKLQTYATAMLGVLKANCQGCDMSDVVGGRVIVPLGPRPAGGWQQTSLNQIDTNNNPTVTYSTNPTTWTPPTTVNVTGIPDQFRTTLEVNASLSTAFPAFFDTVFFVDEIYGRRLMLQSQQAQFSDAYVPYAPAGASAYPPYMYMPQITLDGVAIGTSPLGNDLDGAATSLTLTPHHPFAAPASAGFNYNAPVTRLVDPLYPALIVHGWGHTSESLAAKWQGESGVDQIEPKMWIDHGNDNPAPIFQQPSGDLQRSNIGAAWLAQLSQASELHAEIAGSRFQHLHSLGVVATEENITVPFVGGYVQLCGTSVYGFCGNGGPPLNGIMPVDQLGYLDVETSFGLTSRSSNGTQRRAAVHAIAATAAALEGSVFEQLMDSPDTSSTARRFAWGNSPDSTETPASASRPAYLFNILNQGASATLSPDFFLAEGMPTSGSAGTGYAGSFAGYGNWGGEHLPVQPIAIQGAAFAQAGAVNQYLSSNFCGTSTNCEVIASQEAMLGPGFRNGSYWLNTLTVSQAGVVTTTQSGAVAPPNQVGGALIANQYDGNGDPLQIAHVVLNQSVMHKGGGGAMTDPISFNAQSLQNSLKDRFVDRSTQLSVDLKSGVASFATPVLESVGSGEFPYKLERHLEQRGGGMKEFPLYPNTDASISSWVSNWESGADPSNSGPEAMGKSRVEASAATLAAFVAMQDIWSSAQGAQREVSGEIAADWWGRQLLFNVVTLSQGAKSQEFVRLVDGTFLPSAGGGDQLAIASGFTRTATRLYSNTFYGGCPNPCPTPSSSRQWRYQQSQQAGASSFTWTGANGDTKQYSYWEGALTSGNQQALLIAQNSGVSSPAYTYWDSAIQNPQHNSGFHLASWTFPFGVTLTVNGSVGRPTSVTSSLGWTLNFPVMPLYGCTAAQSISAANLNGETTTAAYLGPQAATPTGRPIASCPLSAVYEPINATQPAIRYAYDNLGRVMSAQDAVSIQLGTRGPYQYFIAPGYRGEWDDPLGGQYAVETMPGGSMTAGASFDHFSRTIDELGRVTTANLDGRSRLMSRTFPEQDQEQFAYNGFDQITKLTKVAKPGSGLGSITVSATYDPVWNKLATVTDALSNVTTLSYFASGTTGASLLQQVQRPVLNGQTPTYAYVYNAIGLPTKEVDPTGVTTTHGYDSYGDLTSTKLGAAAVGSNPALNLTTTATPDLVSCPLGTAVSTACPYGGGVGNIVAVSDPRATANSPSDPHGEVTTLQYDVMRRRTDEQKRDLTATAVPLARSHWIYDLNGRVLQEQRASALDGSGNATTWVTTITGYTPTSKTAQVTDPLGNVVQMSYDGDDRPLCTAVRMNPAVFTSLPDACTLSTPSSLTTPDRITRIAYDAASEKSSEIRAFGIVTPAYPATLQTAYATYAYNPNGTVQTVLDANNNLTTYVYDGFDRLHQTQFPSKTRFATGAAALAAGSDLADVETYGYDANSNRLSLTKRDGINQIDWCYDALNREVGKYLRTASTTVSCASPTQSGWDVQTTLDLAGRKTKALYSNLQGVAYGFDAAGRPTSEATNGLTIAYQLDPSSNAVQMTWPDNYHANYFYDGLNRVVSINENSTVVGTGALVSYSYDSLGRRTGAGGSNGSSTGYYYDADSQLIGLEHYLPNSAYNVGFGTFTYNPAHQILSRPTNNTAYDFAGYANGTAWTSTNNGLNQDATIAAIAGGYDANGNEGNDGTRAYTYDAENRVSAVSIPSASTTVSLYYDPIGRLQQQAVTLSGTATNTQFLYAGDKLIAEYSGGAVVNRYVHGGGTDQPVVWYPGPTTAVRNWLHTDNQGSVIAYSNTTGTVTTYQYGAYGEPNAWSGSRFRYTGQIMLPEVKLYYYKARVYDPIAGRFLQTDPIGYTADLDLYEYVGDDPTDKQDPTGDCPECVGALFGAVVGGGLEAGAQLLQSGHITNGGAIVREAAIGLVAGATGAGVGQLVEKGVEVARIASIAGKTAGAIAEGSVSGGTSAGLHGKSIADGAKTGALVGVAAKGASALAGKATAAGINAAESRAMQSTAGNTTAGVLQSGALKMSPATSGAGLPAAAAAGASKATDIAHDAYEKAHEH